MRLNNVLLLVSIIAVLSIGSVSGESIDTPRFAPVTPEVTAQGSSYTSISRGYNSLFTNSAGFAKEGREITFLSATSTSFFAPSIESMGYLDNPEDSENYKEKLSNLDDLSPFITGSGMGIPGSAGIGYVGDKLGLGFAGDVSFYRRNDDDSGEEESVVDIVQTWGLIGGIAFPFSFGPVDLYAGGNIRLMWRSETRNIDSDNGNAPFRSLVGGGLALDAGVIAEYDSFALGLSVRDIGSTEFGYSERVTDEFIGLLTFNGEELSPEDDPYYSKSSYAIPMSAHIGLAFQPDLGDFEWFADPRIHAEYQHVWYSEAKERSLLTHVHMGAEIGTLKIVKLRAGMNQGYVTAGVGVKLLFLDLNAAFFNRGISSYAGDKPENGFALEAAMRF